MCAIETAKFYSILADEISYHNVEQTLPCVHFGGKVCNIHEEFIKCVALKKSQSLRIVATAILVKLDER